MSEPRTSPEVCGMGHSMKRKEDPRFIRGRGNYVDDIQLPGMLHMDIVRSPFAHAKIKSINAEKALKIPGVLAVITGETLAKYNLHWMPTLMSDTQMVLPTEKVMYQAQEVAAVIATDRYVAADGVEAVEVDYEPLPVVVDPFKALAPSAPVLRTDKKDKKDNRIFHWEAGDRAATDKAFADADVVVKQDMYIPRIHVASIETCGCVADFDRVTGKLTVYMTTQAPHAIRTVFALVAGHVGLSEEKIRIVSPDIGGGFGGKVPVYPGYVIATAASVVIGKPIKWIEDRMENLQADSFARDYHIHAELAARKDGTMTALRIQNVIPAEKFPSKSGLGWEYDSGNYGAALRKAMDIIGYEDLRREQAEKRARGELMGIGISSFTEIVGAGPSKHFDILGIKMFDSAEIRVHPTGKAMVRLGVKSQGQGHETTFAQIVAEELGLPVGDIAVEEGDTDTAPYGLGTYASRSTPVAGGATASAARKIREKGRLIAAHLLEASPDDIEWKDYKFQVKGVPAKSKTMQEVAFAAYTNHPQGMEAGLEAVDYYDPPNLTFPFGSYICVVDIDRGTGEVKVRRFVAVDDCGTIINPMIVEGQIHGGLTMGLAPALYEQINYDDDGNIQGGNFMDYLLPTAMETPSWETAKTTTPSPHHPIGAKGVGESATVGAPAAIANAVVDALAHLGVRHLDIPITPWKVQKILKEKGVAE